MSLPLSCGIVGREHIGGGVVPEQQGEPVDLRSGGAVSQPTHQAGKTIQVYR